MFRNFFGLGPSDADVKKLADQMTLLNDYIVKNNVQIVENDTTNPFVKCDFEEALKAQDERKEYFLKVDKGFVSIGGAYYLDFDKAHISRMFGFVADGSKEYENKINQSVNNIFFSRNATTAKPEETNTLLKAFLDAAEQKRAENNAKYQNTRRPNESISTWEREHNELVNPENCRINFNGYLNASVDAITGIEPQHKGKGKTIYKFLLDSLGSFGSTEGGFAKRFHSPTTMSSFNTETRQQMAIYALKPEVQQGFIGKLCDNGVAIEILSTAHRKDIQGGQDQYQRSQEDSYSLNAWNALRMCLEQLEIYISTLPPPSNGNGGGKSKSRSKSIRKKRISHRQKKSHSHKRRAPKRRAPKRLAAN